MILLKCTFETDEIITESMKNKFFILPLINLINFYLVSQIDGEKKLKDLETFCIGQVVVMLNFSRKLKILRIKDLESINYIMIKMHSQIDKDRECECNVNI